jgi:hypothetical protein
MPDAKIKLMGEVRPFYRAHRDTFGHHREAGDHRPDTGGRRVLADHRHASPT